MNALSFQFHALSFSFLFVLKSHTKKAFTLTIWLTSVQLCYLLNSEPNLASNCVDQIKIKTWTEIRSDWKFLCLCELDNERKKSNTTNSEIKTKRNWVFVARVKLFSRTLYSKTYVLNRNKELKEFSVFCFIRLHLNWVDVVMVVLWDHFI